MTFKDRADAGHRLLAMLPPLDPADTVVIALPRGGVPVADVIAHAIGAPLDVTIVRKVGLPNNPELAVAAVTDGAAPKLFVNEDVARAVGRTEDDIWKLAKSELTEAERRRMRYLGERPPVQIAGKTVLVVDDGIATGSTMHAALGLLRSQEPARIILAIPVAPEESLAEFSDVADEVICLATPRPFYAVGAHYGNFDQVADDTVTDALARNRAMLDRKLS